MPRHLTTGLALQVSNPSTPPSPERDVSTPAQTPHTPPRPAPRRPQPVESADRNRPGIVWRQFASVQTALPWLALSMRRMKAAARACGADMSNVTALPWITAICAAPCAVISRRTSPSRA